MTQSTDTSARRASPVWLTQRAPVELGDAFHRIRTRYVEPISDEELVAAAISGMLTALDPYSQYLDADDYADWRARISSEFSGIGIRIRIEDGLAMVAAPVTGSPAANAGLRTGDRIIAIGGIRLEAISRQDVEAMLRGPLGSAITLIVRRGDSEFPVTLTRATIRTPSVTWETVGRVGVLRISHFDRHTQAGLALAIHGIAAELGSQLTGYVLDLRDNPGGLLGQGVLVADSFLDAGTIVSTRGRNGQFLKRSMARPGDLADGKPLVVLINGGSASASEIVAGALQDHGRAVVLGSRSYGKGSVQTVMPLGAGLSALKLTTALYYTPSGRSIQGIGITPDIEVGTGSPRSAADPGDVAIPPVADDAGLLDGGDLQLQHAVELLTGGEVAEKVDL